METLTIENPDEKDTKPIEDGVFQYGLLQVGSKAPRKWAFHIRDLDGLLGGATGRDHFSQFYLDYIWVKEEHRSKGMGKILHEEVVACAQVCGCKRILLSTLNLDAVHFYRKLGYKQLTVIEDYVDGFDLYYMARSIK
jgi:ribosomal protein S18 acetylase RimI-like enzyme